MKEVCFHPQALDELQAQCEYYDACEPGLGAAFAELVRANVQLISAMPRLFPFKQGVQHCYMKGFPFDIAFDEFPERIVIWAVAHTSRMPGYWRERIKGSEGDQEQ